jgi:hypothetical protein
VQYVLFTQALQVEGQLTQFPFFPKVPSKHGTHLPFNNYPSEQLKQLSKVQVVQWINLLVQATQFTLFKVKLSEGHDVLHKLLYNKKFD